jgi:hypothetical protein
MTPAESGTNIPATPAIKLRSIATGTSGTTSRFAIRDISETSPNINRTIGTVISCALLVSMRMSMSEKRESDAVRRQANESTAWVVFVLATIMSAARM